MSIQTCPYMRRVPWLAARLCQGDDMARKQFEQHAKGRSGFLTLLIAVGWLAAMLMIYVTWFR